MIKDVLRLGEKLNVFRLEYIGKPRIELMWIKTDKFLYFLECRTNYFLECKHYTIRLNFIKLTSVSHIWVMFMGQWPIYESWTGQGLTFLPIAV